MRGKACNGLADKVFFWPCSSPSNLLQISLKSNQLNRGHHEHPRPLKNYKVIIYHEFRLNIYLKKTSESKFHSSFYKYLNIWYIYISIYMQVSLKSNQLNRGHHELSEPLKNKRVKIYHDYRLSIYFKNK